MSLNDLGTLSRLFGRQAVCLNVPGSDADGWQRIEVDFATGAPVRVRAYSITGAWQALREQIPGYADWQLTHPSKALGADDGAERVHSPETRADPPIPSQDPT